MPPAQRKLVTDHDAFSYFAARYGITVVGAVIPSQTTQAEPSAGDTARLIALIRREHVQAVFPESSLNREARADDRARDRRDAPTTTLYGDTLGPKGSAGATYIAMERERDAMVRGFTGGACSCGCTRVSE